MLEQWLAARRSGEDSVSLDESLPLALLGVTSVQYAQLATELGVPVHAVASAKSLHDLRVLSQLDSRGITLARTDYERFSQDLKRYPCHSGTVRPFSLWKKILVTGATGHLGQHFAALLEREGIGVVRASRSLGLDVSKPHFGLDDESYQRLRADCHAVIHCAAIVNWSSSYSDLRRSNVESIMHVTRFCRGTEGSGEKALLFLGSGADFPESPASLEWLEECCSPYMVSKTAAEALLQQLCSHAVVVRPGLVVWNSETGQYNDIDAVSRLAKAMLQDSLVWAVEEECDDTIDGMNVDTFCQAAFEVFKKGGPAVYNMRGTFQLTKFLDACEVAPPRMPYTEWHHAMTQRCHANPAHPLAALMPHVDAAGPPFTVEGKGLLSSRCRAALGADLAQSLSCVSGYSAFAHALTVGLPAGDVDVHSSDADVSDGAHPPS